MSKSKRPSRPPVKLQLPLPSLQIGLYRGNRLVRLTEVADPRHQFCVAFNSMHGTGLIAIPVVLESKGGGQ